MEIKEVMENPGRMIKVEWRGHFRGYNGYNWALGWISEKSDAKIMVLILQAFGAVKYTGRREVNELRIPMSAITKIQQLSTI